MITTWIDVVLTLSGVTVCLYLWRAWKKKKRYVLCKIKRVYVRSRYPITRKRCTRVSTKYTHLADSLSSDEEKMD